MAFSWFRPIAALMIASTLSVAVLAQNDNNRKAISKTPPANTTNQKRALALIDQILGASSKFSDDWLRLNTQNQIADLLWYHDKARSRRLFEETFRGAESLQPKVGQSYASSAPFLVDSLRFEMRKEILKAVSMHDAKLAEKLAGSIQSSKLTRNPDLATRQITIDRELVEHNLAVALSIAEKDPQRAARLARDSLNRIINYGFTKLIRSMRTRNPELADQLFLDALEALHRRPSYISNKIAILAPYVFPETKAEPDDYSNEGINPEMVTRFLDFVYQALMRQTPDSQVQEDSPFGKSSFEHRTLKALLPHFERRDAKRAAEMRALLDEIVRKIDEADRRDLFDGEEDAWAELFRGNVTDLLSKAEAAKSVEEKDELYSDAAFLLALRDGDFDKALPLIERIADQQKRGYILSMLRDGATESAIQIGATEQAYRYASETTDLSTQIDAFQKIAQKMIDQKRMERAEEVVNETARLIPNLSEESGKATDFLTLAGVASRLSPTKGFEIMRSAVDAINHAEFGPHWSRQTIYKKNKTAALPQAARDVTGLEYLDFTGLTVLSQSDFSKALTIAQAIQMKEASLLAQLAVCRGVLTSSGARQ